MHCTTPGLCGVPENGKVLKFLLLYAKRFSNRTLGSLHFCWHFPDSLTSPCVMVIWAPHWVVVRRPSSNCRGCRGCGNRGGGGGGCDEGDLGRQCYGNTSRKLGLGNLNEGGWVHSSVRLALRFSVSHGFAGELVVVRLHGLAGVQRAARLQNERLLTVLLFPVHGAVGAVCCLMSFLSAYVTTMGRPAGIASEPVMLLHVA
mmetsp:Transcript_14471/g.27813  ORF Transcript_14471/g.27813 Transcript_14471/m.27813 type:complete len:202 (+) Transcript_14471:229-834(+)